MDSKSVRIIFVVPKEYENEHQTSDEMRQAFEACKQNSINIGWYTEENCLKVGLKKTDFMVFESFKGETFEKAKTTKSVRIVGPLCLLTCLTEGRPIPNLSWPIYSIAMIGCTITTSSFSKQEKKNLQDKIQYMAGCFLSNLTENCTHLVTDSVKSEKYIKAAEAGVKILLSSWVEEIWEASHKSNVHCNDEQFNKHRCPTFYKLTVCATGLNTMQRSTLNNLVTENGGLYKEQLYISLTDILVCSDAATTSAKYKAAKKRNIKCVNFNWVLDSVEKGYALPDNLYSITIVGTSTPTKESTEVNPNFSTISNISVLPSNQTDLQPTLINATDVFKLTPFKPGGLKRKSDSNDYNILADEIDLKEVRMAGPFLDGCGIYLAGFGTEQREKLCKVLNFSGASRYDEINERVTHVIVGDQTCHDIKMMISNGKLKDLLLVSVDWLIDSISKRQPVDEQPYLINTINTEIDEPSSPLSKKSAHLMHKDSTITIADEESGLLEVAECIPETNLVQQYLQLDTLSEEDTLVKLLQNVEQKTTETVQSKDELKVSKSSERTPLNSSPSKINSLSSAIDDDSSQPIDPIYKGFTFIIVGFTEEQAEQVEYAIQTMAGKVMNRSCKGIPDYAVVPMFSSQPSNIATEIVTDLWISECWSENELHTIEYYHRPIMVKENTTPLKNCVVTISSYINFERKFLRHLIIELGGVSQEQFSRINCSANDIVASTHLVSPTATGKKYTAAIKWGLPVITKDWLLECAKISKLPSEVPYLVGDAKCPIRMDFNVIENNDGSCGFGSPSRSRRETDNLYKSAVLIEDNKTPPTENKNLDASSNHSVIADLGSNKSGINYTPENRLLKNVLNKSDICSQVTPVQQIITEARKHNLLGTPQECLPIPKPWDHVDTPETPLGAFIHPNPSPNLRKQMVRFLNTLPEYKPRRNSTPLSELKRRLWDKICPPKEEDKNKSEQPNFDSDYETSDYQDTTNIHKNLSASDDTLENHFKQFQDMLASGSGQQLNSNSRRQSTLPVIASEVKDSQPNTVGWDDCVDCDVVQKIDKKTPVFMFSGIEQDTRELLMERLKGVGGKIANLSSFDPNCTHLICSKAMRNEKVLACIASGKWILHCSYIDKCIAEGKLVDEEPFEYGNPKSRDNAFIQENKENETRLLAIHYWRKEISRRGYGAFHDMRAIIVAQKKDSIVRVVEAGGGVVVESSPPFTEPVHATHCLLDLKFVKDFSDYIPLAQQGIYCVNTLYINEYLQRTADDVRDYIVPSLSPFYSTK